MLRYRLCYIICYMLCYVVSYVKCYRLCSVKCYVMLYHTVCYTTLYVICYVICVILHSTDVGGGWIEIESLTSFISSWDSDEMHDLGQRLIMVLLIQAACPWQGGGGLLRLRFYGDLEPPGQTHSLNFNYAHSSQGITTLGPENRETGGANWNHIHTGNSCPSVTYLGPLEPD